MEKRIEINPKIMQGKPVIRGTRIGVSKVLEKLSTGMRVEELLESYPNLKKEDIYACLVYASQVIANEEVIILKAS